MSTYLKTAAMSLLSKTLQTFLSKYLSDVDVEGVALPSVYDGSGWGVRLSNVKLREGVELMKTTPGTLVKTRKRRRRRCHPNNKPNFDQQGRPDQDEEPCGNVGEDDEIRVEALKEGGGDKSNRGRSYSSSITPPVMPTVDEADISSSGSFISGDGDEEDGFGADEGGSRPVTPVQERQSFLSCFSSKRTASKGAKPANTTMTATTKRESESEIETDSSSPVNNENNESAILNEKSSNHESTSKSFPDVNGSKSVQEDNEDDDDSDDDDDFELEDEEYEQRVRLCLGTGGRVGILDVRLIGKELHVMVEDADVTIEAIPILEEMDEDENDNHVHDGDDVESDDLDTSNRSKRESYKGASASGTQPDNSKNAAERRKSKSKTEPKRETVGDRVLADNPIARLISSIPHLFLRDIRIRIIVRDEAAPVSGEQTEESENAETDTEAHEEFVNESSSLDRVKPSSKDTMVEIGIDFLSVTSGDDVLSHFHQQTEGELESLQNNIGQDQGESQIGKPPPLLKIPSHVSTDTTNASGPDHTNEFLVRQIRTSRGPEGGIFVQIYAPTPKLHPKLSRGVHSNGELWARQQWILTTEHRLLRFSGLDVLARIHLGTRKVDSGYSWFYGEYVEEEETGSDLESLLLFGGIDTVAPGPQLPLPPIEPRMSRGMTPRKSSSTGNDMLETAAASVAAVDKSGTEYILESGPTVRSDVDNTARSSLYPGADHYDMDKNGIQSCKVPSLFHRVSRGMEPASNKRCQHLPSELCELCWKSPPGEDLSGESTLDSSTPMPGLVLQIGLRDAVEINIDRPSLESISLLNSLFTKPPEESSKEETPADDDDNDSKVAATSVAISSPPAEESSRGTSATTGFFSGIFYGRTSEEVKEEEPSDAFEAHMQPEKISVIGICLPKILFRIHVLKPDIEDRGLGFCYWDIAMDCLTLDRQTLDSDEKAFQDMKLDVGRLVWKEFRGIESKEVISLGMPPPTRRRTDSQSSMSSMVDDHQSKKSPWPSAACALLDIPPPLESMVYKSRERHGVQLRLVSVSSPQNQESVARTQVFLRLGVTSIDSPYAIKNEINQVIGGCLGYIRDRRVPQKREVGDTPEPDQEVKNDRNDNGTTTKIDEAQSQQDSRMTFTIQIDGGQVDLAPLVAMKLPMTRFSGERSSSAGLFFEALVDKLDFAYGKTEPVINKGCPTLPQLASLPEHVRMHILLCLKDLNPLEKALGLKHEKNAFRQIKSVDKGMVKMAKSLSKRGSKHNRSRKSSRNSTHGSRRQEILSQIMSLDDSELTELWTVHQRYQRKLAKKRNES